MRRQSDSANLLRTSGLNVRLAFTLFSLITYTSLLLQLQ